MTLALELTPPMIAGWRMRDSAGAPRALTGSRLRAVAVYKGPAAGRAPRAVIQPAARTAATPRPANAHVQRVPPGAAVTSTVDPKRATRPGWRGSKRLTPTE